MWVSCKGLVDPAGDLRAGCTIGGMTNTADRKRRRLIADQERSGQTMREFRASLGITAGTIFDWRRVVDTLCQADLDAAPKCVGPMAKCTSRISSSPSPQSGGLPSIRRPANMSTARWRAWPSSGRSNSATSSPSKAVSIAGVCGLVQRERTATCTALGALKQRTSELRRTDSGGS